MSTPLLMLYDPATNFATPYPSEANQYREYHPNKAWLYNPYTGIQRTSEELADDIFGVKLESNKTEVVPAVVESVEYNGAEFQAILSKECDGCSFYRESYKTKTCHFDYFNRPENMGCTKLTRQDGKSIIWIRQV